MKFKETCNTFKVKFSENLVVVGGEDKTQSYILIDENGNEYPAVLVSEEVVFTATEDDIREGKVAATSSGVTVGTKVIPSYNTTEGFFVFSPGERLVIPFYDKRALYDYTKFQAIICPFDVTARDSVAAEKVSINDKVYMVSSSVPLSTVSKDSTIKSIDLGIYNESDIDYVVRYFTYKEIY